NETFAGRITFIAYSLEADTRTIAARVEVDNPNYHLKPGMYASALIRMPVGKITELDPAKLAASQPATLPQELDPRPVVQNYLAITAVLAQDKTDAAAAGKLEQAAQALAAKAPNQPDLAALAKATQGFAAKSLDEQRAALPQMTAALVNILHVVPVPGMSLYLAHCPMAKADWIAGSKKIINPYKGADMLTCGSITGAIETSPAAPGTPAAAVSQNERFVTGYYCPVTPDRLYDLPAHCPVDKFPTKYVQIEKVPAVPESAVIDTGTRKIVYRETVAGSGTFDMVEVKLGPRAKSEGAEYYPVLAGLKPGDLVASQGAFLVDAENRLNPGASVQFLGATAAEKKH
ncbi:MAG: efflux RND transporter periplasmic adaptor subunit, partial [Phycisphaerae bacterium]